MARSAAARARARGNGGSRREEKIREEGETGAGEWIEEASGSLSPLSRCPGGSGARHGEAGGGGGRRGRSPLCQKAEEEDDPAPGALGLLRRQVRFSSSFFFSVLLTNVLLFISAPKRW